MPATGLEEDIPLARKLYCPTPNPVMDETTIAFDLPTPARDVRMSVYNLRGQVVRVLRDGPESAGRHAVVWDGLNEQGARAAAGTYFIRLEVDDWRAAERVTILR